MLRIDRHRQNKLRFFEKAIKNQFRNRHLLDLALTHKSYAFEQPSKHKVEWNERLEFFGDSVLGIVVSEYLYKKFKTAQEGELSKLKAHLVCTDTLVKNAAILKVGDFLLLGRGEERGAGRSQVSNLSGALEAIIGAVYLDRGIKAAERFILNALKSDLFDVSKKDRPNRDFKSLLQERCLKKFGQIPRYEIISQEGPEHKKEFVVDVKICNHVYGRGWGLNKKNAQQMAAREALDKNNNWE